MLKHIPTHLIAGPLGAGKTSLIRQLLAQKPAGESWAVLINEFGRIGLDAALLGREEGGIGLGEVAGGCLCCVNGVPFRVALTRLLRRVRPDRLLIEPSGLGHPTELLRQLGEAPWVGVLALQPALLVLDAAAMAAGEQLPASQAGALEQAGLLVLNKAESVGAEARAQLAGRLPARPLYWTTQGQLPLALLPGLTAHAGPGAISLPEVPPPLPELWCDPLRPLCAVQAQEQGWSIGWRWHPSQSFDLQRLQQWLAERPWRRAKLVLRGRTGWLSANAVDGAPLNWQASAWRRDSRVELIFSEAQDEAWLKAGMEACRLAG